MGPPPGIRRTEAGGASLAYEVLGEGPPMVLLGGTLWGRANWDPLLEQLAERFTLLSVDLRGYGASTSGGVESATISTWADDTVAILDAVGWDAAHINGTSFGGTIALAVAVRHPQRCLSVIATGCSARADAARIERYNASIRVAEEVGMGIELIDRMARQRGAPIDMANHANMVARSLAMSAGTPLETWVAANRALRDVDLGADLASCRVPTLLIAGELDRTTPMVHAPPGLGMAQIAQAMPSARLVVIEGAGHSTIFEHPKEHLQATLEFIAQLQADNQAPSARVRAWRRPDAADVAGVARQYGFDLTQEGAATFQKLVVHELEGIAAFLDEEPPPQPHAQPAMRDRGRMPTEGDDPYGAWLWRCQIPGASEGVLSGKTVSFKDHIAVAGVPLTFGLPALRGFRPDFDATVVRRALAAGGTVIGKNNLDGFAGGGGLPGRAGPFPRTANPHAPAHATGSSSSGSAAAVAAGQVDISFGGDQGGSVRIPAAFTGCIGLKPTFGLVSHFGAAFGLDQSTDHIGPMGRTHRDVAAALEAVAGYDELDPRACRDVPLRLDVLARLDDGIDGFRVGLLREGFDGAAPDVYDAVMAAVDVLRAGGAHVSWTSVPEQLRIGDPHTAITWEGARAIRQTCIFGAFARGVYPESVVEAVACALADDPDALADNKKLQVIVGEFAWRLFHGRAYARAHNARATFIAAYDRELKNYDVLLTPTCLTTAPLWVAPDDPRSAAGFDYGPYVRNTRPFNFTGHPALAIPCGRGDDGLPVSMQLIGRVFEDATLLRVGSAFEQSVDWSSLIACDPTGRTRQVQCEG